MTLEEKKAVLSCLVYLEGPRLTLEPEIPEKYRLTLFYLFLSSGETTPNKQVLQVMHFPRVHQESPLLGVRPRSTWDGHES